MSDKLLFKILITDGCTDYRKADDADKQRISEEWSSRLSESMSEYYSNHIAEYEKVSCDRELKNKL